MILVTGASGFLGRHLLQALQEQPLPVKALYYSKKPDIHLKNITWQQCNLLDVYEVTAAMQGISHIYHCAGIVSFNPKRKNEIIEHNISITANIVNAALENNVEKLVHVSSVAALGRKEDKGSALLIDEETHFVESKNNSNYAVGKYLAEMEVWRAMAEGLNAVIANPGIILGEGDWDNGSANLMKVVSSEFPWYTSGSNGWVDVKDVTRIMILLMNSNVRDERFIISENNYSYLELFTKMAKALGKKPPQHKASSFATEIVWRVETLKSKLTGKHTSISKETARTAQVKCEYDNTKFLNTFPDFRYKPMEVTIERMAEAFKTGK